MKVAFIRNRINGKPTPVWVSKQRHDDIALSVRKAPGGTTWIIDLWLMEPREIAPGNIWAWRAGWDAPTKDDKPDWAEIASTTRKILAEIADSGTFVL